jgi:hypothetical protein
MGLGHSPQIVTNGLVLAFDIGNGLKNATGNISTNLIQNGNFVNGSGSPQEADSNPTNTIVQLANPGDSPYVLRQNGVYTEYQLNIYSGMVANTTYVMSGWYAKSSDYDGQDLMFHARTYSSSGAHIATGNDAGTLIYSTVVNGITWEYRYQTIATPSDFNNNFNWYVGYGQPGAHNGYRYYTNLKLEKGTYPSIYNLLGTGSNGECVNGLSYNSSNGGSLSFDGTNDYINCGSNSNLNLGAFTLSAWVKVSTNVSDYRAIIADESPGGAPWNYRLYVNRDNGILVCDINGGGYGSVTSTFAINNNTWYHVCATRSSVGGTLSMYINEVLNNTSTDGSSRSTLANQVWIGQSPYSGGAYPMNGNIAQVQIYNKALTASEVQQNFNALRGRFGI